MLFKQNMNYEQIFIEISLKINLYLTPPQTGESRFLLQFYGEQILELS